MGTARLPLEARDWEILRTLLRLRYMTTRELAGAFFTSDDLARRRLRKLSGWDLIRSHRKGLVEAVRYPWRLTSHGIDRVVAEFPGELIPDGLADRLSDGNPINVDHREAIAPVDPVRRRLPAGAGCHPRRPRHPCRAAARPVSSRVRPSARSSSEVAYESRRNPPDWGPNASPGETTTR